MTAIDTSVLPNSGYLIGGEWVEPGAGPTVAHVNPATGQQQAELAIAGAETVDAAVSAARAATDEWRRFGVAERRALLLRLADAIEQDGPNLAEICVLENGTPLAFAQLFASATPADWFRYYAGWVDKIEGRTIPTYPGNNLDYTRLEPHGVVGLLTAFNGPMAFIGFKAAPALAAGNTIVVKPSELAPWTSVRFAQLAHEVGFPPGVINVVTGDGTTGRAVAAHPGIDKISFTGGGGTAKDILTVAAQNLTPVTLELGGKSAAIAFADADLDATVMTIVQSAVAMLSGQVCLAGTRLLVERSVYDEVIERIRAMVGFLQVGDPTDPNTHMGPLISEFHCNRVLDVIAGAQSRGDGKLLTGGNRLDGDLGNGFFVEPTVFTDVDPGSPLAQQEIFGPVLSVIPFDNDAEAVTIANSTSYGLAGYVFTSDVKRAHRVADDLDAGYISVNCYSLLPPNAPFGGVKGSGYGREGGQDGLHEMLRTKNVQLSLD